MAPVQHNPILWVELLIATVAATVAIVVAENAIKGYDRRPHNVPLLFGECLAEQHSAYLVFFIAIAIGSGGFTNSHGGFVLTMTVMLWLAFYAQGVRSTMRHEDHINSDHACTSGCKARLKQATHWKIYGMNLIFGVILLTLAVYLSYAAVKAPPQ